MFDYLQTKNDLKLEARLDNNSYDESQLIEIKVPVNIAYQTSRPNYERCDGEIVIDGITYKYVKRKVTQDTLFLMCIPNAEKMRLESVKNHVYKVVNDLDQNNDSKKSDSKSVFKNLQTVYNEPDFLTGFDILPVVHYNLWLPEAVPALPASFQNSGTDQFL